MDSGPLWVFFLFLLCVTIHFISVDFTSFRGKMRLYGVFYAASEAVTVTASEQGEDNPS